MPKLKMTGFGRFVLFLIVAFPIAYFGAKYLQNSGTLDKMKEKVEDIQSPSPQAQPESNDDILSQIENKSKTQADKEAEAIIAEQQRKIDELKRQNEALRKKEAAQPSSTNIPPPPLNSPRSSGLDDLIATAEENMRRKGNDPDLGGSVSNTSENATSLATWTFSFSNISGSIELFQKGNKLITRTTYAGGSRVDVQEIEQRNDRLYVQGSPTSEYYILKPNGDLDAYDNSGFLTTCRRR